MKKKMSNLIRVGSSKCRHKNIVTGMNSAVIWLLSRLDMAKEEI
jgi:hypothetical protein